MKVFLVATTLVVSTLFVLSPAMAGPSEELLCQAASRGDVRTVSALLKKRVPIDGKSKNGDTALHEAAFAGNVAVVKLLLKNHADPNSQDSSKRTPLWLTISRKGLVPQHQRNLYSIADLLLEKGADPNARSLIGTTPLMWVAEAGDLDMALLLIKHGADVKVKDRSGKTALDIAKKKGHRHLFQALRDYGAGARSSQSAVLSTKAFTLPGEIVAFDSLSTHRQVWVKVMSSGSANARSVAGQLIDKGVADGSLIWLTAADRMTFTGNATGIISEVRIQGRLGTWWVPNKALKEAGIPVPESNYSPWDK